MTAWTQQGKEFPVWDKIAGRFHYGVNLGWGLDAWGISQWGSPAWVGAVKSVIEWIKSGKSLSSWISSGKPSVIWSKQ